MVWKIKINNFIILMYKIFFKELNVFAFLCIMFTVAAFFKNFEL